MASMEEPLLTATGTEKKGRAGGEESLVVSEAKKQLYLAGPLIAGCLLQNIVQMISVMFVGHLGELALSSASMATSFAGVTGFSLLAGMASSLDTLCGQAFGAKQGYLLGVYKQRAMLVLCLVSVPIAAIWAYTGEILLFFGQDSEIAAGAGSYIRWMIPALFVYAPLQCHVRFLQSQNIVVPVMLSSGATALNHALVCWLLVYKLGMGNNGAALANAISFLTNVSILALYVRLSPSCKSTWTGFSGEAFRDILGFLKLAVPSALMVCMEWWSFELMVLLSGLLPNPKLETAVLSISVNTNSLAFMVPFGLGAAISTRVSNELGAGRPQAARLATRVVMLLAFLACASEGLVMFLVRNLWGYAYSNEEEVAVYIATMMQILAISIVVDGIQGVLSESTLLFEVEAEAMETFYSRRMKGLPEKFRNHSQVLLGAVDDKRWVLLSTSPRITSSVSLQRSFLPLSAILEEWGFGLDCCADWRCRCSCFLPFPYAPTGIKKQ